jgi:hypothetical protein
MKYLIFEREKKERKKRTHAHIGISNVTTPLIIRALLD